MKRKPLSKKEIKELNVKLEPFGISFDKKQKMELVDEKYYFIDREMALFILNDSIIPTLKWQLTHGVSLPAVTVDMGAVKFITNGSDVMRPGITDIPTGLEKRSIVTIIDEQNKRPIVIGELLFSSEELQEKDSGKVIKNIHYIGDDLWNMVL